MEPLEIAPGVYDVGVTDWNIRDFHGYSTDLGTTYNALSWILKKLTMSLATTRSWTIRAGWLG
jgi:flavorubredoxin